MAAWWLPGSGGTVFLTMPRTGVLGRMVMHHLVHHRGQMRV